MSKLLKKINFKYALRALRSRNYRLFLAGQCISLIGTWMQQIAVGWLVYRLTNSAFLLGVVGFIGQLPVFLIAPFGGVFADRWDRRRVLVITQTLSMVQAFILAILIFTNNIEVWAIIALQVFLGFVNAFDVPVRQSFVVDMVNDKKDLGNAIALNSSTVNSARLIGPSIAGLIIATAGEGICFFANGISYIAVIIALMAMKIPKYKPKLSKTNAFQELKEGFKYVSEFAPIKYIILFLALISLVGTPYAVLMPVFTKEVLHGGPHAFGFLIGLAGGGALIGAIYLAFQKSVSGLEKSIMYAAFLFGGALMILSFSNVLWFSMVVVFIAGFGMMVQMASSNTIIQTVVDDNKRGRVMSIYAMAFIGMVPFGNLLSGSLANLIGVKSTLLLSGLICIIGAFFYSRKLPFITKAIACVCGNLEVNNSGQSEIANK